MNKIQIMYFGKNVLVDEDQVTLLQEKELLVKQAVNMKKYPIEMKVIMSKIIRLNRKIRQNVIFI